MKVEKQWEASGKLEDLEPALKEIINQLRMGVSPELAYALVYRLRREIGYVVRELGVGTPNSDHDKQAEEIIEAQKWQSRKE